MHALIVSADLLPVLSRMARLFPFLRTISSWYIAGQGGWSSALLGPTMLMPCKKRKLKKWKKIVTQSRKTKKSVVT